MSTNRTATVVAAATTVLLSTLAAPALARHTRACGDHVWREGRTFRVLPTGVDDTENLQCALDQASRSGRGARVRLVAGTYVTRQIVVRDFHGTLRGAGADETIVTNPEQPMPVAKTEWHLAEPGPEHPWPMLFTALHSAITVSDMTVRIRGAAPLEGWTGGPGCGSDGFLPCVNDLLAVFFVGPDWGRPERNRASATFRRVRLEGERNATPWPAPGGSYFGFNTISGIYAFGSPLRGRLRLLSSTVRTIYDAVQVAVLSRSEVSVRGNVFEDVGGATVGDLEQSFFDFAYNDMRVSPDQPAPMGLWLHDYVDALRDSSLFVRHNRFEGPIGIQITATFEGQVTCLLFDNDVEQVSGIGILLESGTRGCQVLGTPPHLVVDRGIGNVVGGRR